MFAEPVSDRIEGRNEAERTGGVFDNLPSQGPGQPLISRRDFRLAFVTGGFSGYHPFAEIPPQSATIIQLQSGN